MFRAVRSRPIEAELPDAGTADAAIRRRRGQRAVAEALESRSLLSASFGAEHFAAPGYPIHPGGQQATTVSRFHSTFGRGEQGHTDGSQVGNIRSGRGDGWTAGPTATDVTSTRPTGGVTSTPAVSKPAPGEDTDKSGRGHGGSSDTAGRHTVWQNSRWHNGSYDSHGSALPTETDGDAGKSDDAAGSPVATGGTGWSLPSRADGVVIVIESPGLPAGDDAEAVVVIRPATAWPVSSQSTWTHANWHDGFGPTYLHGGTGSHGAAANPGYDATSGQGNVYGSTGTGQYRPSDISARPTGELDVGTPRHEAETPPPPRVNVPASVSASPSPPEVRPATSTPVAVVVVGQPMAVASASAPAADVNVPGAGRAATDRGGAADRSTVGTNAGQPGVATRGPAAAVAPVITGSREPATGLVERLGSGIPSGDDAGRSLSTNLSGTMAAAAKLTWISLTTANASGVTGDAVPAAGSTWWEQARRFVPGTLLGLADGASTGRPADDDWVLKATAVVGFTAAAAGCVYCQVASAYRSATEQGEPKRPAARNDPNRDTRRRVVKVRSRVIAG